MKDTQSALGLTASITNQGRSYLAKKLKKKLGYFYSHFFMIKKKLAIAKKGSIAKKEAIAKKGAINKTIVFIQKQSYLLWILFPKSKKLYEWIMICSIQKKLKDRTSIRVYGFHSWLKLQPCLLIGGDP